MWLLVLLAVLVICAFRVIQSLVKKQKYFEERGVPYRKSYPIIGSMWPVVSKRVLFAEWIVDLYNEFPNAKYSGIFDFTDPVYVIRDAELIKSLMVKNFNSFTDHRTMISENLDPLFGRSLVATKGERWKEMRSIASPLFTSSKMKGIFQLMYKCSQDYCDYLAKQPQPISLDMKDVYTRYTSDIIATAIFGISVNSLIDENNEFYRMCKKATDLSGWSNLKLFLFRWSPTLMKFLNQALISDIVAKFYRSLVKVTIKSHKEQTVPKPDLIQLLIQSKHKASNEALTDDEIAGQTFTFLFAGFDTASALMCFTTYQLAVNQEIQDKLRNEFDRALEEGNGEVSYEALTDLKYVDMVLNETLRYYCPITFTDRVAVEEFELPPPVDGSNKPVLIKPGTSIWFPLLGLHKDPNHFAEPYKFDPEHFSTKNKEHIRPFSYLPFGAGPRNCPGGRFALMETKLILMGLLRRFIIKPCEKTHVPLVLSEGLPNSSGVHELWLSLEPRNLSTDGS